MICKRGHSATDEVASRLVTCDKQTHAKAQLLGSRQFGGGNDGTEQVVGWFSDSAVELVIEVLKEVNCRHGTGVGRVGCSDRDRVGPGAEGGEILGGPTTAVVD